MSKIQKNNSNEISGFPELTLQEQILFEEIKKQIIKLEELYGFNPMESRLVEDLETMREKGIDGKEIFTLNLFHKDEIVEKNENSQKLALHFDLTLPLARYVGENYKSLPFPLKRWQIQKVYRGETARESNGRFCEFYQSDIDIIGKDKLSLLYDAELPCIIYKIFREIIGTERFVIRINNRKLLEGLFSEFNIRDTTQLKKAIKIIDNIDKVEQNETTQELVKIGISENNAFKIYNFFNICKNSRPSDVIEVLSNISNVNDLLKQGINELITVIKTMILNIPEAYIMVDPSIARGLDYYTGTVYETNMIDFPQLGSVCSGGRYDDLVGNLSCDNKLKFPGCGISIGLSRLIPTLIKNNILHINTMTLTTVLIAVQDEKYIDKYNYIATKLRDANISIVVNYNAGRLKTQIEYAVKYGYKFILIGKDELNENKIQVKEINSGKENEIIQIDDIVDFIKQKNTGTINYKTKSLPNDRKFLNITVEKMTIDIQNYISPNFAS